MSKPILTSISPNTDKSDIRLTIKTIFKPWSWQKGRQANNLSNKLTQLLDQRHAWLFNAGRNALEVGLKSLNLKPTDEILCQAFTCVAVPNAIKWAGSKPIFVDTSKNSPNLNLHDLKQKITKNSKALIIQHTFGNPDQLDKIKLICQQHKLILIEDCAHTIGSKYQGKPIGSFGDLTILSFGRDKAISSVFGGALLTSNKRMAQKINKQHQSITHPSNFWVFRQLLHPIIMTTIKPIYFSIGKYLVFIYQKSGLLSWPVTQKEKICQASLPLRKLPNALAILALHQLNKLELINQNRQQIVSLYQKSLKTLNLKSFPLLRFPLLINNPEKLIKKAKKNQILLGDWYRPVIAPKGVNLKSINYKPGSCPNAENISTKIVNLPTNISKTQARQVIRLVLNYVNH